MKHMDCFILRQMKMVNFGEKGDGGWFLLKIMQCEAYRSRNDNLAKNAVINSRLTAKIMFSLPLLPCPKPREDTSSLSISGRCRVICSGIVSSSAGSHSWQHIQRGNSYSKGEVLNRG